MGMKQFLVLRKENISIQEQCCQESSWTWNSGKLWFVQVI